MGIFVIRGNLDTVRNSRGAHTQTKGYVSTEQEGDHP